MMMSCQQPTQFGRQIALPDFREDGLIGRNGLAFGLQQDQALQNEQTAQGHDEGRHPQVGDDVALPHAPPETHRQAEEHRYDARPGEDYRVQRLAWK